MNQDIKNNICNAKQWQRTAWIFFFMLCYSLVKVVLYATVLFQVIYTLIFSEQQKRVRVFGSQLAVYVYQLLCYMTYNNDIKPFPFDAWPTGEERMLATTQNVDGIVEAEVLIEENVEKK